MVALLFVLLVFAFAVSDIEWTDLTWNPSTGCDKISPGCKHCYADRMAKRLKAMGQEKYINGFELTLHPDTLDWPLTIKKPSRIFVNSMSDLFHEGIPLEFIQQVFATMNKAHWHQFQVLTKRSARLKELAPHLTWTTNIWMGVSVESPAYLSRIDDLRHVPAAVRFLSVEPLLEAIPTLDLTGIHWVIVGGESGPGARAMKEEWAQEILAICNSAKVPLFFKQWGGVRKKKAGRTLNDRTYDEYPATAQPGTYPGTPEDGVIRSLEEFAQRFVQIKLK